MCAVCTDAVHSVALWTRVTSHDCECVKCVPLHHTFGHVWSMCRCSPFRSTLNTSYITRLDMCEVCTEAVHSVALWTRVTSHICTCVKCVPLHHTFVHVCSVYRCSPFRSTLNTSYITRLDMCEVCTEAVHSVALWTRVTSHICTCVKCVPLHHTFGHVWSVYRCSPFRSTLNTSYITRLYMCEACTVTSHVWTCVKCVRKQSIP